MGQSSRAVTPLLVQEPHRFAAFCSHGCVRKRNPRPFPGPSDLTTPGSLKSSKAKKGHRAAAEAAGGFKSHALSGRSIAPSSHGLRSAHRPNLCGSAALWTSRRNGSTAQRAAKTPPSTLDPVEGGARGADAVRGQAEQGASWQEQGAGERRALNGAPLPASERISSGESIARSERVVLERLELREGAPDAVPSGRDREEPPVVRDGAGGHGPQEGDEAQPGAGRHVAPARQPDERAEAGGAGGVLEWAARLYDSVTPRMRGLVLLNILTLLYGSNVAVVKENNGLLDPATFSAGRFGIASLAFLPFLPAAFARPRVRAAGAELGVWATIAYLSQTVGLLDTDAGRAAFISTFTVIEVPIIAGLFGAKIPRITWAAAAAAVCGVGLLETTNGKPSLVGDAWTFFSALVFGVHMLRSEHHSKHLNHDDALPLIALQLLVTAVFSTAWSLGLHAHDTGGFAAEVAAGDWPAVATSLRAAPWLAMVYTGLASTAFCLWIECVSLRDVSATEAAMVYTVEPLYGAGFAWVLLGERWGPKGWFGAALILGGSLAMQLFGKKEEAAGGKGGGSNAAAAAVAAAAVVSAMAAAADAGPGGDAAIESAGLLADSIDLDNFAALLRICALAGLADDGGGGGGDSSGESDSEQ